MIATLGSVSSTVSGTLDRVRAVVAKPRAIDAKCRLAIETGPGPGFHSALSEIAALDLGNDEVTPATSETHGPEATDDVAGAILEGGPNGNAPIVSSTVNEAVLDAGQSDEGDGTGMLNEDHASFMAANDQPAIVSGIETVAMEQLVEAIADSIISRIIVLTPFAGEDDDATALALARELTSRASPVAFVGLSSRGNVDGELATFSDRAGICDLIAGARSLGDTIHRDPYSLLHVVPSGGLDLNALDKAELADLQTYLSAFSDAYPVCILDWPVSGLDLTDYVRNADTAIVVAAPRQAGSEVAAIGELIAARGWGEVIHLVAEEDEALSETERDLEYA